MKRYDTAISNYISSIMRASVEARKMLYDDLLQLPEDPHFIVGRIMNSNGWIDTPIVTGVYMPACDCYRIESAPYLL